MNDADFEMLANQCEGAYEQWLRVRAMALAVESTKAWRCTAADDVARAREYYEFIKGSDDANLHS